MTLLARLASGSVATWVQIAVTITAQIVLVPLYLSHWDKETYGAWLMIQATIGLTTLVDTGHQAFLANEFLKVGDRDRALISKIFYSSLPIAALIGLIEIVMVTGAITIGMQQWLSGLDAAEHSGLIRQAGIVLIIQAALWLILGGCSGIAVRVLVAFGHYSRMTWWGICASMATATAPAVAVMFGSDLLGAGIALGFATCLYCIPMFADMWRIMKHEGILPVRPDWTRGLVNFGRSMLLTVKTVLDIARLQGLRLLLSPIVGVADMAAFATMRTGANVALQGLGTVTNPLMPELMRFLRHKDQARTEAAFGFVWLLVMLVICPAVILLQWLAPSVFEVWTKGKIPFDAKLFAMLSLDVLIYALAQPAIAVVHGNNLLRSQLLLSMLASSTLIGGVVLFVPSMGIGGAGVAIVSAEVVALIGYAIIASLWLKSNAMHWPTLAFTTVAASVAIGGVALGSIAVYPQEAKLIAVLAMTLNLGMLALYWLQLPHMARLRVASIVASSMPEAR